MHYGQPQRAGARRRAFLARRAALAWRALGRHPSWPTHAPPAFLAVPSRPRLAAALLGRGASDRPLGRGGLCPRPSWPAPRIIWPGSAWPRPSWPPRRLAGERLAAPFLAAARRLAGERLAAPFLAAARRLATAFLAVERFLTTRLATAFFAVRALLGRRPLGRGLLGRGPLLADGLLGWGPFLGRFSGRSPSLRGYCHRCTSLGALSLNRGEACATPRSNSPRRAHCRTVVCDERHARGEVCDFTPFTPTRPRTPNCEGISQWNDATRRAQTSDPTRSLGALHIAVSQHT